MSELQLGELGLTPAESSVYLALLRGGPASGPRIAERAGISRSRLYETLENLQDQGMVEGGGGYGAQFRPVAPEYALANLVERKRQRLEDEERVAKELMTTLTSLVTPEGGGEGNVVEVVRHKRAIGERFDRLQLEAERTVEMFIKAPILGRMKNPTQRKIMARGVRVRSLYDKDFADENPSTVRHFVSGGEEARIYPGSLPLKMALFDECRLLMPLETPDERTPITTVIIRHRALAACLHTLFEYFWAESSPVEGGRS